MKTDILLCGVGGQGILSVAFVLDYCALRAGCFFKQPEVHGMSQRGGAVHAQFRVSDQPVASGLIPAGEADLLIALEPMEALRYLYYLSPRSQLVTDIAPNVNIADYPPLPELYEVLFRMPRILAADGAHLARKAGVARGQNMVLLGAALPFLPFSPEWVEEGIERLFAAKEERIRHGNIAAFRRGRAAAQFYTAMTAAGADGRVVSRILPRLDLPAWPLSDEILDAWKLFFMSPRAALLADQILRSERILTGEIAAPQILLEEHPAAMTEVPRS